MAIHLGNKTKLTTDIEKAFIEIGGGDPLKALTEEELRRILPVAINKIGKRRPSILRKIFEQYVQAGEVEKSAYNK